MKSVLSSANRSRVALMLGLVTLLPLFATVSPAEAQPPRSAPAYGYRAKRTTTVRRTYRRAPVVRRYRSERTVTRRTRTNRYGRPTTIIRRTFR